MLPVPIRMTIDVRRGRLAVEFADGAEIEDVMAPDQLPGWSGLSRTVADLPSQTLSITLDSGDTIDLSLEWPGEDDRPDPSATVVYLDQCHWVAIAPSIYRPELLAPDVVVAASTIAEMARQGEIVLPISSAHLYEMARRGKRRHDVELTMLQLSRGWQMVNPLRVRREEIRAALLGEIPVCQDCVTLAPGAIFSADTRPSSPSDMPIAFAELHVRMTAATALVAVVVEDSEEPNDEGHAAAKKWVEASEKHARMAQRDGRTPDETRCYAWGALLSDLAVDITEVAAMLESMNRRWSAGLPTRLGLTSNARRSFATFGRSRTTGTATVRTAGSRMI